MPVMPAGAQLSDDRHYWWDEAAKQWQPVEHAGGEHHDAVADAHVASSGGQNSVAVKDGQGNTLLHGHAVPITMQGATDEWGALKRAAVESVLAAAGIHLEVLQATAAAVGGTVAFGIQGSIADVVGIDAGAGLYVGPSGEMGWYTSLGSDLGVVIGGSVEGVGAAVKGGPDVFAGEFLSLTVVGGEVYVGGATLLYSPSSRAFVGIALHVGFGFGLPLDVYATYSNTWLYPM